MFEQLKAEEPPMTEILKAAKVDDKGIEGLNKNKTTKQQNNKTTKQKKKKSEVNKSTQEFFQNYKKNGN